MLENPHLGSGTFSPIEIDADRLFDRIEATVASLILNGPSTDDDGWFWLLLDGTEE